MTRWLVLVVAIAGSRVASAQPTATSVLAQVQQYYSGAKQLSAKFRQVVSHKTFGTTQTSQGNLYVAKPDQFRLDYSQVVRGVPKVEKTFDYDGATFWLVDHANREYRMQPVTASAMPAAVLFVTNPAALSKDFNVALANPTTLSLTPKQVSAQYKEIRLSVAGDGHVTHTTVLDGNGDTEDLDLYEPNTKTAIPGKTFVIAQAALKGFKKLP